VLIRLNSKVTKVSWKVWQTASVKTNVPGCMIYLLTHSGTTSTQAVAKGWCPVCRQTGHKRSLFFLNRTIWRFNVLCPVNRPITQTSRCRVFVQKHFT